MSRPVYQLKFKQTDDTGRESWRNVGHVTELSDGSMVGTLYAIPVTAGGWDGTFRLYPVDHGGKRRRAAENADEEISDAAAGGTGEGESPGAHTPSTDL